MYKYFDWMTFVLKVGGNLEHQNRLIENLSFKFNGDNNIEVNLLINTLKGISESYKCVTKINNPETEVELKIESFREGSFEVLLTAINTTAPILAPYVQSSLSNIKTFLDIIKLKKDLKGKKPLEVTQEEDKSKILNHHGEIHYHNCHVTNLYFNNPIIDKNITDIFSQLIENNKREEVSISNDIENVVINEKEYSNMATILVETPQDIVLKKFEDIVEAELPLKKPDLIGESRWQFIYKGKAIDVTIEDKSFLHKVQTGKIRKLYAHVRIPVKMKVEVFMDDKFDEVSKKFTIIEVTGNIIEPKSFKQMEI